MGVKKIVGFVILAVLVFHTGWYALSLAITHRKIPDEHVIAAFQNDYPDLLIKDRVKGIREEQSLTVNGQRLHLDILPREAGRLTLVFIPGTSVYAEIYMKFLYAMYREGFNVVSFDPRGHGRSSGLRGDYTIDELVEDALLICAYARERFGGKIVIAGSSQGGIVAFYAAARDDTLDGAVCHNMADLNGRDNLILSKFTLPAPVIPLAQRIMGMYRNFAIPISLYLNITQEHLPDGTNAAGFLRKDPLSNTWITLRAMNSLVETPLAKPVEKIRVPVMLIHSTKDVMLPQAFVENIYDRLTCPKHYLLIKDRGHLVLTNNTDEVSPGVAAWLRTL